MQQPRPRNRAVAFHFPYGHFDLFRIVDGLNHATSAFKVLQRPLRV